MVIDWVLARDWVVIDWGLARDWSVINIWIQFSWNDTYLVLEKSASYFVYNVFIFCTFNRRTIFVNGTLKQNLYNTIIDGRMAAIIKNMEWNNANKESLCFPNHRGDYLHVRIDTNSVEDFAQLCTRTFCSFAVALYPSNIQSHIRTGYWLVTVCAHGGLIVLPHWETRLPAPWLDSPFSHIILTLSQPVLALS